GFARRRGDPGNRGVDRHIHDALVDQWIGLRWRGGVGPDDADRAQVVRVLAVDLRELDEALPRVVLARVEPVARAGGGAGQLILRRTPARYGLARRRSIR